MFNMALQPLLMQTIGNNGIMALQFQGHQRLLDTFQAQQMFNQRHIAMQQATANDRAAIERQLTGMGRIVGTNVGDPAVQESIQRMAGNIMGMMPILADIMPETVDKMFGVRGSEMVMNRQMFMGGRFAVDPVTGARGLSGDTVGFMASRLQKDLFSGDLTPMRGMGMGEAGVLFGEMQRRGLMGGANITRDQLANMGPEQAKDVREQEVQRIGTRLKSMANAVAVMRDIFGDAGKPDAPMRELIDGLQALTQGGLANLSPGDLSRMLRTTHELSRMTGMTIGGVMQMTARGAGMADQLGLDRRFATLATQGAMGFADAFGMAVPAGGFFMPSKDEAAAMDQQLRLMATASPLANQMGATFRLAQLAPGNAVLSDLMRRMKSGEVINQDKWMQEMLTSGLRPENITSTLRDIAGNQEAIFQNRLGDDVRRLQGKVDVSQIIHGSMIGLVADKFGRQGAAGIVGRITGAALNLRPEDLVSEGARIQGIVNQLGDLDEEPLRAVLQSGFARVNARITGDPRLSHLRNVDTMLAMHNIPTLERDALTRRQAEARGTLATSLGGIGQRGFMRNFADFLMSATDDTSFKDFLAMVPGGGVSRQEIEAALGKGGLQSGNDMVRLHNEIQAHIRRNEFEAAEAKMPAMNEAARQMNAATAGFSDRLNSVYSEPFSAQIATNRLMELDWVGGAPSKVIQEAVQKISPGRMPELMRVLNVARQARQTWGISPDEITANDLNWLVADDKISAEDKKLAESRLGKMGDVFKMIETFKEDKGEPQVMRLDEKQSLKLIGKLELTGEDGKMFVNLSEVSGQPVSSV